MVLGILSITCFWIFAGIPAVIFGHMSRKNIEQSRGRLKGEGMALAGLIMGYGSVLMGLPAVAVLAAILVPKVLHNKNAANENEAMSTIRTINTSETTYLTAFNAGYARDLASMGPGDGDCSSATYRSAQHACLLDGQLAGPTCTGANWCIKGGFKFAVTPVCDDRLGCSGYVITAVPLKPGVSGVANFCSASDLVIRTRRGPPPALPLETEEACKKWPPVP